MKKTTAEILNNAENSLLVTHGVNSDVVSWIMSELKYQAKRWNQETTTTAGLHDPFEFNLFIKNYNSEAETFLSRNGEPEASELALINLRKVAGMIVSCLFQNGYEDYLKFGLFTDHKYLNTATHVVSFVSHWTQENEKQIIFQSETSCVINLVYMLDAIVTLVSKKHIINELVMR